VWVAAMRTAAPAEIAIPPTGKPVVVAQDEIFQFDGAGVDVDAPARGGVAPCAVKRLIFTLEHDPRPDRLRCSHPHPRRLH